MDAISYAPNLAAFFVRDPQATMAGLKAIANKGKNSEKDRQLERVSAAIEAFESKLDAVAERAKELQARDTVMKRAAIGIMCKKIPELEGKIHPDQAWALLKRAEPEEAQKLAAGLGYFNSSSPLSERVYIGSVRPAVGPLDRI